MIVVKSNPVTNYYRLKCAQAEKRRITQQAISMTRVNERHRAAVMLRRLAWENEREAQQASSEEQKLICLKCAKNYVVVALLIEKGTEP